MPADRARLRVLIEKWTKEREAYLQGMAFPDPAGQMNKASAETCRYFLLDLKNLLDAEADSPADAGPRPSETVVPDLNQPVYRWNADLAVVQLLGYRPKSAPPVSPEPRS